MPLRALILAAALLASSSASAANIYTTLTACVNKGNDMARRGDRLDAWVWFCAEQNYFQFSGCTYSPPAIYKPECWVRRPNLAWPTAEAK